MTTSFTIALLVFILYFASSYKSVKNDPKKEKDLLVLMVVSFSLFVLVSYLFNWI